MNTEKQAGGGNRKSTLSIGRTTERRSTPSTVESPLSTGSMRPAEPLEVLLLHEDLQTGLRAKYILDNLEAKLATKPRFLVELWRFDMLEVSELQARAVEDAKSANIVIVSLHGNRELPARVRDWLTRWTGAKNGGSCALVVSLDASVQGSPLADATLEHLRRTAALAGLDLFPHFGDIPRSPRNWTLHQPQAMMPPISWEPRPHFTGGINE